MSYCDHIVCAKLDHAAMEDRDLVWCSFIAHKWPASSASLTWGTQGTRMHYGKKTSQWRQCDAFGNVLLGNHHCCGLHVTLICTTYQKCYTISLNDVKFQQAGSQKTKMVQEVMIPTQVSICEICWTNESDLWMPHLQLTGLKGSIAIVTSWCEIPRHTFRGRVEFMARQVRAVLATKRRPTRY